MIPRILEPEVMDSPLEATDYNTMDHSQVNRVFVDDLLCALSRVTNLPVRGQCTILDVGTGTAQIPIELCGRPGHWHITAADLAQSMLDVAAENIGAARLGEWIKLQHLDAKRLPFENGQFDVVMSNSIIHHIPAPEECLAEMVRVVTPGGLLFGRDLLRPESVAELGRLVELYAGDANPHQKQMFGESLHAALTLDEVRAMAVPFGISPECVQQNSDRHWTLVCSPGCLFKA
ncbi:MAG TPA: class I SAM-dependent methyltransferase [Planctomycetaceae bacterium]|jgi:ubiquinone/menaquinone biosynthesis C-methylase UbiE|nr:class I SAM-dependent methyltransferase [Planctomycetaceae bacterium]